MNHKERTPRSNPWWRSFLF